MNVLSMARYDSETHVTISLLIFLATVIAWLATGTDLTVRIQILPQPCHAAVLGGVVYPNKGHLSR